MSQDSERPSNDPDDFFNPNASNMGAVARALRADPGDANRNTLQAAGYVAEPRSAHNGLHIVKEPRDPLKTTDDFVTAPKPTEVGAVTARQLPPSVPPAVNETSSAIEAEGDTTLPGMMAFDPKPQQAQGVVDDPDHRNSTVLSKAEIDATVQRIARELGNPEAAEPSFAAYDTDPPPAHDEPSYRFTSPPPDKDWKLGAIIVAGILTVGLVVVVGLRFLSGPRETTIDTSSQPLLTHIEPTVRPTPVSPPARPTRPMTAPVQPQVMPHHCRLMGNLTLSTAAQQGYTRVFLFPGQPANPQTRICPPKDRTFP